jgi:hypothetical protein
MQGVLPIVNPSGDRKAARAHKGCKIYIFVTEFMPDNIHVLDTYNTARNYGHRCTTIRLR